MSPQLLCLLGLMALGTVHAEMKMERGSCPSFWFSFNSRCFTYVPKRMTWSDAEKNCMSQDAHLVSVLSEEDDEFVRTLIQHNDPSQQSTFIGLHDLFFEGGWSWTDGSRVNYTKWRSGQPDGGYVENCGSVATSEELWWDVPCTIERPSVCVLRTETSC